MKLCRQTLRKNINTNEEGELPLQTATEFMQYIPICWWQCNNKNAIVKCNPCSFDNKCEKLWTAVYNQSATAKQYQDVPHFYESCQKTN